MGEKSVANLLRAIEGVASVAASRGCLRGWGFVLSANRLRRSWPATSDRSTPIAASSQEDLQHSDGIGPDSSRAASICFFEQPPNRAMVGALARRRRRLTAPKRARAAVGMLAGKTFVLTGTLPTLTRDEATELIVAAGGKVTGR